MPAIESTVGFLGSKLVNKVSPKISESPNISGGVKVALGFFLSAQKNSTMKNVGNGVIIAGLTDLAAANIPQLGIGRMGIAGPSYRQYALRNHVGNAPHGSVANDDVTLD
ncbi:MAG: hypothetical protein GXO85_02260 [Chlorobi bacterium]|nr:hypothetical protein [Chlorobiota bacterium]